MTPFQQFLLSAASTTVAFLIVFLVIVFICYIVSDDETVKPPEPKQPVNLVFGAGTFSEGNVTAKHLRATTFNVEQLLQWFDNLTEDEKLMAAKFMYQKLSPNQRQEFLITISTRN